MTLTFLSNDSLLNSGDGYAFAVCFAIIAWYTSLQIAKFVPHNISHSQQVIYVHATIVIFAVFEAFLSFFDSTLDMNEKWHILLLYCMPSLAQLWMTNFLFFVWMKIYFSSGYTLNWLRYLRTSAITLCSISFIICSAAIYCSFYHIFDYSFIFTLGLHV